MLTADNYVAAINSIDAETISDRLKLVLSVKRLHKATVAYLEASSDVSLFKGPFLLRGAGSIDIEMVSCDTLFGQMGGAVFPGVRVGGALGSDFWLMVESGKVITLHHDARFAELAGECEAKTASGFIKAFTKVGSIVDIGQLVKLQTELHNTFGDVEPPRGPRFLRVVAKCLGGLGKLARMLGTPAAEFLGPIDDAMVDDMQAGDRRWAKLQKQDAEEVRNIDLGHAQLCDMPSLKKYPNLEVLVLSGNPELVADEVIKTVSPLTKLRRLEASANEWDDEVLAALREALPHCRLVVEPARGVGMISAALRSASRGGANKVRALDLSDLELKSLPKNIHELTTLEELNLSGNERLNWPNAFKTLAAFPELRKLTLQRCKLTTLPEEFAELSQLETVDLSGGTWGEHNYIEVHQALPILAKLPNLKRLTLNHNRVVPGKWNTIIDTLALPAFSQLEHIGLADLSSFQNAGGTFMSELLDIIKTMKSLRSANLAGLGIKTLPEGLDAEELKVLNASNNEITALAETSLSQLTHFTSHDTQLTSLDGLEKCTELVSLDIQARLGQRQAFQVAEWLGELEHLENLTLLHLAFPELPMTLGQLSKLRKLHVCSGELASLPKTIGKLQELRELNLASMIHGCTKLIGLHPNVAGCAKLEVFSADKSGLYALPEAIVECTHLRDVQLNDLKGLRDAEGTLSLLAQLPALKRLSMNFSGLERIPRALAQCTTLEELSLLGEFQNFNKAASVICNLPQLRRLDLSYYAITRLPEGFDKLKNLEWFRYQTGKADSWLDCDSMVESLAQLPNFKHLELNDIGGRWPDMPPSIGDLARLETLTLTSVRWSSLPEEIGRLHNLKELHLDRCNSVRSPERRRLQKLLPDCKIVITDW